MQNCCRNNSLLPHNKIISSFAWIDGPRAFYFRMFWNNISFFRFWWQAYTKRCTNNYLISRVKRLSSLTLCGWSGAFKFRIWFKIRKNAVKTNILNQKYLVKNSEPPLPFFENREQKTLILVKNTLTVSIFRLKHEIYHSKCSFKSI